MNTRDMVLTAVMAAVICVLSPLSIPIGPVPISLANLAIFLTLYLLGMKRGSFSVLIFLLIGLAGAPVFSGFAGGIGKLTGPTGGYIVGYLPMALCAGAVIERFERKPVPSVLGMVLSTILLYALGTAWFVHLTGRTFGAALALCVTPFAPLDLVKILVCALAGPVLFRALMKAGVLERRA